MTNEEVSRCLDLMVGLWPDWDITPEQKRAWEEALKPRQNFGRVEWAITHHYRESRMKFPVPAKVLAHLNAADADAARSSNAPAQVERRESESACAYRVQEDRHKAEAWALAKTDDELIAIAERVSVFAGRIGAMLPIGRRPGASREEWAAALRRPVTALILCAGVSAIREREKGTA